MEKCHRKHAFLEKLGLCSEFGQSSSPPPSSFDQLREVPDVQRLVKKTLPNVPFSSPAGQQLLKYTDFRSSKSYVTGRQQRLESFCRSTTPSSSILKGLKRKKRKYFTLKARIPDISKMDGRNYAFTRHPLSRKNYQSKTFTADMIKQCNAASVPVKRLTDIELKTTKPLNTIKNLLKRCTPVSVSLIKLTSASIQSIKCRLGRPPRRKSTYKSFNMIDEKLKPTQPRKTFKPIKPRKKFEDISKRCTPVSVNLIKLTSHAIQAIKSRLGRPPRRMSTFKTINMTLHLQMLTVT